MGADIAIGEKIKDLREKNGLTQEELANRSELSKGFISQLERDLTSPSIATLLDILECLGTDINDFFSKKTPSKVIFSKKDFFEQENKELHHEIKWIVPNAQKNDMEPILLTLYSGGKTNLDTAHQGQEFGYVLKGCVILHIAERQYKVKKGECFYFAPSSKHYLENTGSADAVILWVSCPPSF